MLFQWDDKYQVGVKVIDERHRRLVELLNGLHDAMVAGKAHEMLGGLMQQHTYGRFAGAATA